MLEDLIFKVEKNPDGGYAAKGIGVSIYTQASTMEGLKEAIMDAVHCHYADGKKRNIRLCIAR